MRFIPESQTVCHSLKAHQHRLTKLRSLFSIATGDVYVKYGGGRNATVFLFGGVSSIKEEAKCYMYLSSFLRLPRSIAQRTDLTMAAKLVIAALHGRAWGEKEEAWPSVATIAKDIGESESTIHRAVKLLVEKGLIEVEQRRDPNNPSRNLTNVYHLVDVEDPSFNLTPPSVKVTPGTGGKVTPELDKSQVEERNNQTYVVDDSFSSRREPKRGPFNEWDEPQGADSVQALMKLHREGKKAEANAMARRMNERLNALHK